MKACKNCICEQEYMLKEHRMGLVSTFKKGGVHPDDKKSLAKASVIERIPLPDRKSVV